MSLSPKTSTAPKTTTIADLMTAPNNLWYRIHVFVHDLRRFKDNETSRTRLDSIADPSYIGAPYFTAEEAATLKATVVDGEKTLARVLEETLDRKLETRMKKRVESGDFRVCAAHDLAPVFEKTFNINEKQLAKNGRFQKLLKGGLVLGAGQTFKGVGKSKGNDKKQGGAR